MTSIALALLLGLVLGALAGYLWASSRAGAADKELNDAFERLAAQALSRNNEDFLKLARETLGGVQQRMLGEFDNKKSTFEGLVTPLQKSLEQMDKQLREIENARIKAYSDVSNSLQQIAQTNAALQKETGNLASSLRHTEVRGRWGELQLRNAVELAGMSEHCDFTEQTTVDTEDGRQRPDMIINMPGGRQVVVDAKAVLNEYLDSIETQDDAERARLRQAHARHVRERVVELSSRAYWKQFESPEFAVLFLPGESFFSAALETDKDLLGFAMERKVILATPTTLLALLKAVSYGWGQEKLTQGAAQIREEAQNLYDRLAKWSSHLAGLGDKLGAAVKSYNDSVGSLETRVLPAARRMKELGVPAKNELKDAPRIERTVREVQALDSEKETTP